MVSSPSSAFIGHLYDWPIDRGEKTYRVIVVEPPFLDPAMHAAIFNSAISTLLAPANAPVSDLKANAPGIEPFDLATFPEAFLPATDLVTAIKLLTGVDRFGCVHVGLRPSIADGHLFKPDALAVVVEQLGAIPGVDAADLAKFSSWLSKQGASKRFNIACLFTVDTEARIRICLHPKMVRSKYEARALPENDMTEADVLSLVTLSPSDPNLLSITMQPLICSDALQLDTDKPGHLPIDAINSSGASFDRRLPDYVDVVSVATCTPQPESYSQNSIGSRVWHQQFRNAFTRAAGNAAVQRHAHAAFVLANFWSVGPQSNSSNSSNNGGLSGVFLPVKLPVEGYPDFVQLSTFGADKGGVEDTWSSPASELDPSRRVRGYLAQLSPYGVDLPKARMLSFTINRLPRHAPPWGSSVGLRNVSLRSAKASNSSAEFVFLESDDVDIQ